MGGQCIWAGFPHASGGECGAVRAVGREHPGAYLAALARSVPIDIERAAQSLDGHARPRIHCFIATSEIHLRYKFNKSQEQVLEEAVEGVELARRYVDDVEFSAEDATRTEIGYLCRVCEAAVDAGVDGIGALYAARFSYTQFRTAVNWRHKLEQGGGVLKSQGVHAIDLALRWLGPARSVSGELAIIHPAREVEDFALINLRFANGAVGEVYAAYTDRQPEAMTAALQGTRGKINFCLSPYQPAMNQVSISRQGETKAVALSEHAALDPVYPGLLHCSQRAIAHIVDGLLNGRPSSLDGAAGRRSIEIVLAGYDSQRRGTKVRLPLVSFEGASLADCFLRFDAGPHDLQE